MIIPLLEKENRVAVKKLNDLNHEFRLVSYNLMVVKGPLEGNSSTDFKFPRFKSLLEAGILHFLNVFLASTDRYFLYVQHFG